MTVLNVSAGGVENEHRLISGVYPHLCTYSFEQGEKAALNECGIGAIVPWANRLWMITYGAHYPKGSTHKLYSIDDNLELTTHPESVGGTPAGRMIHRESDQLILGHYLIDSKGAIRTISPKTMPARVTAVARHLVDPANKVYVIDMEGMIYEIDVHTLAVQRLFKKPVPGWHGKGGYTAQGRLVISNNGERSFHGAASPTEVEDLPRHPENAGVLAEWDSKDWRIVERRQYCEVTGSAGIHAVPDDKGPLWAIGWDRRSLRLKLLDKGKWHTFLLPKAAHNNDPRHGWFTEWPRIRDIGNGRMMMDMHGMFYLFPPSFAAASTSGIRPISSHLRYIPDFCEFNGRLVIASDESTVMQNDLCGQPQSNLWFGQLDDLRAWGPASGYGGPWVNDAVKANTPSDPFLVAGFDRRLLHLATDVPATVTLEVDQNGTGQFEKARTIPVDGYRAEELGPGLKAEWIRLSIDRDCTASAYFHGTDSDLRVHDEEMFGELADTGGSAVGGLLYPAKKNRDLLLQDEMQRTALAVGRDIEFRSTDYDEDLAAVLSVDKCFGTDSASVVVTDGNARYRLPRGNVAFDNPFEFGWPRCVREVESERNLANIHGTFYEIPRSNLDPSPDWERMRPVASHSKQIHDFCTWQGLLVMTGMAERKDGRADRGFWSDDDAAGVWCGAIDDLWQLGKPTGQGGPWKDTPVNAGQPSDPYLMTGYDRKTLELRADTDTTITMEVNVDHQSGWHTYKQIKVTGGKPFVYRFPEAYSAHWIRFISGVECTATAWLTYE